CAATTAKLLGLDARGVGHAIALAASFAGSLIEGQRTGARDADFAEAQAARSGMWAASLAAQGFQGAPTALEGEGGFYHAFTGSHTGDLAYTFTGPPKADLGEIVADLGRRWEVLDVKFKIYPTPGFNQPVVWLASEVTARHKLVADEIEHVTLEMNYLETLYPSPRFPRPPAPDGSGFGRTAYMLAYTLIAGDYPVLEANVEDPRDAGASSGAEIAARVAALQRKVEIVGAVGRECFAPRLTVTLRDGRRIAGEYHGRELMWDFARDAKELRRFVPGRPITRVAPASCNRRSRSRSAGCPCTEMVIFDGSRPASFASRSSVARLSRSCSGVMRFGSQPSPHATTRCSTFFAPPPSSTGGWGFCSGLGNDFTGGKS